MQAVVMALLCPVYYTLFLLKTNNMYQPVMFHNETLRFLLGSQHLANLPEMSPEGAVAKLGPVALGCDCRK